MPFIFEKSKCIKKVSIFYQFRHDMDTRITWFKPMSFQMENRKWELDRWYRLEYVQEDAWIRGAIDGVTVMDVIDDAYSNNGPVLLNGRVALRCMMRTDMTFRNLRVWNRPHFQSVPFTTQPG
jgi:hypothetical protein